MNLLEAGGAFSWLGWPSPWFSIRDVGVVAERVEGRRKNIYKNVKDTDGIFGGQEFRRSQSASF